MPLYEHLVEPFLWNIFECIHIQQTFIATKLTTHLVNGFKKSDSFKNHDTLTSIFKMDQIRIVASTKKASHYNI